MASQSKHMSSILPQPLGLSPRELLEHWTKEKERLEDLRGNSRYIVPSQSLETVSTRITQCQENIAKSEKELKQAMKAGSVTVNVTNALIQGEAGAGKTSTKCVLFGQPPPEVRTSTPLAEAPVQIHVDKSTGGLRNVKKVSEIKVQSVDNAWSPVSEGDLQTLVAELIAKHTRTDVPSPLEDGSKQVMADQNTDSSLDLDLHVSSTASCSLKHEHLNQHHQDRSELKDTKQHNVPTPSGEDVGDNTTAASSDSKLKQVIGNIHGELIDLAEAKHIDIDQESSSRVELVDLEAKHIEHKCDVLGSNWIYFIDSGGQPHFHNLLPHFVHGISVALFVHRLSQTLEDHPMVEYYEEGQSISKPYRSPLTTEDTLKCLVRSLQSHTVDGEKPKLVIVGTFADQILNSGETLEQKNLKLLNLLAEFTEQLIFFNDAFEQLNFPLNAKNPGTDEERIAEQIRDVVENSPSRSIEIPLWWYVLEITMKKLSTHLNRQVLSKQECLEVARQLNISEDALVEALKFFHDQHIFHYYPELLPDVVFTTPQVLLDKLTELVKEAYRMREVTSNPPATQARCHSTSGNWKKFRDQGIITLDFLKKFTQHYVNGLFNPPDLLRLFTKHLILTPLTDGLHLVPDFKSRLIQYYMPSLLDMLSLPEVERQRIFSSPAEPILIRFPNGWPRAGVFCCLQVLLIQQLKWKLVLQKQRPKLIAQNCVMLRPPNTTCVVTLIDAFSYLEVHVEAGLDICRNECPKIRKSILDGIDASCRILRYRNDRPHLAFFCPCTFSSQPPSASKSSLPQRHAAELIQREACLRCIVDETASFKVNQNHTIWLKESGIEHLGAVEDEFTSLARMRTRASATHLSLGIEHASVGAIADGFTSLAVMRTTSAALLPSSVQSPAVSAENEFTSLAKERVNTPSIPKQQATLTMEDLLHKSGLSDNDINKECRDDHILEIYQKVEKWEQVAVHLRLQRADIEAIKHNYMYNYELMSFYALKKWQSVGIAHGTATYSVLLKALLKCGTWSWQWMCANSLLHQRIHKDPPIDPCIKEGIEHLRI